MNKLLLHLFCYFSSLSLSAQSVEHINAIVLDISTQRPLIGVHISYDNGRYGTATNENGRFSLPLDKVFQDDTLRFSYIGYQTFQLPIAEILFSTPDTILLSDASSDLPQIEINSVNPLYVIQQAYERIKTNYRPEPHKILGFYREENSQQAPEKRTILFTEGVLETTKNKISQRRSKIEDRVNLIKGYRRDLPSYLLTSDKDTIAVAAVRQGAYVSVGVDVVRDVIFLFNSHNYRRYHFEFEGVDFLNDRLLYKIRFAPKKFDLRAPYEGMLYIEKASFAVVKADYAFTMPTVDRFNQVDRSNLDLNYRLFSCQYFFYNGFWYLEQAKVDQVFIEQQSGIPIKVNMHYITTEINPKISKIRASEPLVFDDVMAKRVDAVSPDYWADYVILKEID